MLTKLLSILLLLANTISYAQVVVKGKIVDATTNEPLSGASIRCADEGCHKTCTAPAIVRSLRVGAELQFVGSYLVTFSKSSKTDVMIS